MSGHAWTVGAVVLAALFILIAAETCHGYRVREAEEAAVRADSAARAARERAREGEDSLAVLREAYEARDSAAAVALDSVGRLTDRLRETRRGLDADFEVLRSAPAEGDTVVPRSTFDSLAAVAERRVAVADSVAAAERERAERYRMLWLDADAGWERADSVIAAKNRALTEMEAAARRWEDAYRAEANPSLLARLGGSLPEVVGTAAVTLGVVVLVTR